MARRVALDFDKRFGFQMPSLCLLCLPWRLCVSEAHNMPLNQELVNTALYGRILSYLYISHRSNQSHDEQQPKHGPRVQTPQDAFDTHAAASRSEVNTSSGGAPNPVSEAARYTGASERPPVLGNRLVLAVFIFGGRVL
ncbi:unnamed protein product [Gadus morhua 'NCC']